jgi:hypothetical protein
MDFILDGHGIGRSYLSIAAALKILALNPTGIWINIPIKAAERVSPDSFRKWKHRVNSVATFYKGDCLDDPTNRGALGPHYDVLEGKVDSFIEAIDDMKGQILRFTAV